MPLLNKDKIPLPGALQIFSLWLQGRTATSMLNQSQGNYAQVPICHCSHHVTRRHVALVLQLPQHRQACFKSVARGTQWRSSFFHRRALGQGSDTGSATWPPRPEPDQVDQSCLKTRLRASQPGRKYAIILKVHKGL